MASNFSNIGFQVDSRKEFEDLVIRAASRSKPVPTFVGGAYLHFSTPEGVELWLQISPHQALVGCNPHFVGGTGHLGDGGFAVDVNRIISFEDSPLDGRLVGTIASEEQIGCPIVLDVPDFRQYVARLTLPTRARFQISAFPREFSAYASEEALRAHQAAQLDGPGMAAESFIPSGTFKPGGEIIEPPEARAVLSGRILAAERRINSFSERPFYALSVKTFGGQIDMPVDPLFMSATPVVGGVVFGSFWLSARLLEPLPQPPAPMSAAAPAPPPEAAPKQKSRWRFW